MTEASSSSFPKSVQPGIPNRPEPPAGWKVLKLRQLLKPVMRPVAMKDDETYQLVKAKRSRGGIVARERLKGRDILTKTQFVVRAGDFLISRRQISHGACGLVPPELDGALVSNEYLALRPTEKLDLGFLIHLSHSVYFQQTCFHSSIGVHVEKLVFKPEVWLDWSFNIPPLDEQRRIAAVLDAWDEAVDDLLRMASAKRRYFRGWVQKALAELNAPRKELSEIAQLVKTKVDPSRSQHSSSIELDNLEAGTGVLLGQTDLPADAGTRAEFQAGDVLFGKLRPYLNKYYFAEQAGLASTECWILRAKTGCDSRFLYLLTQAPAFQAAANIPTGSRMPRADWDIVQNAPLPVPHIMIQQRAANAAMGLQREAFVFSEQATLLRRQNAASCKSSSPASGACPRPSTG